MSLKVKKLIMVTGEANHNKYYNLYEVGDGTFRVEYGRVDKTKINESYSMSMWDKKLREKLKKGYQDVTHLFIEDNGSTASVTTAQAQITDKTVNSLINDLQRYANKSITENYSVSSQKVTQAMVDAAQIILNDINTAMKAGANAKTINDKLLKLYVTIPRQMKRVQEHLFEDGTAVSVIEKKIVDEQDTLDVMAGQVALNAANNTSPESKESTSILDAMGLEIVEGNANDYKIVKKLMEEKADQLVRVYKVVHKMTQPRFEKCVAKKKNKATQLFFHGSRNQNWFNILSTGLLIRPSCAIHIGSMFGDSIYGANKARKAIGYTSIRGSYWTNGNDNKAFLGVFEFHIGEQKHIYKHDSSCYSLNASKLEREGKDSVYAHGGIDLRNDEFMVYTTEQCTIKYLIEIK